MLVLVGLKPDSKIVEKRNVSTCLPQHSRKYVCGESNIVKKKYFRGISKNAKEYLLLQKTLQLNFTQYGHVVSYPFINEKNKLS